ncbi:hypothetical protein [Agrobacterium tumefaciens]|uniref:hypothetical protein n=1 Tax=Agrobacterium tumefaciens TaxID=358 RepID=UPI001CBC1E72|nr:hypothetical protein [Agrobacterium tumefaciens]
MGKRSLYPPPVADKAATMARFDALPSAVRRAIASAAFQIHPQAAEKRLGRGVSPERCAESLLANDPHRSGRAGGSN